MWGLLTGILPIFAKASIYIYGQTPSSQSQIDRVMQLCTDGVYCQESNGTGSVVVKAVLVTDAAFSGFIMDKFFMHLPFPTPTIGMQLICVIQKRIRDVTNG